MRMFGISWVVVGFLTSGCSVITDPSGLVGPGDQDGGRIDATVRDAAPDGCDVAAEVCNGLDDDCDGMLDEEPTECSFPNGITGCVDGTCQLIGCVNDYGDCDSAVEGCEAHLVGDRAHCGGCDMQCSVEERCMSSTCVAPELHWMTLVTGIGSGYLTSVQLDATGSVYVLGRSDGDGVFAEAEVVDRRWFLGRLSPSDGRLDWFQTIRPNATGMGDVRDMITTDLGIVHAVGTVQGSTSLLTDDGYPIVEGNFVWTIRPDGTTRDARRIAVPTSGSSVVQAVDVMQDATLLLAGHLEGELDGYLSEGRDVLILTGAAEALQAIVVGGTGGQEAADVASTPDGFCVCGWHNGPTDFGGGELPSRSLGQDAFVACFSESGVHRWSRGYSGPGNDRGQSIAVDEAGNVYLLVGTDGSLAIEGADVGDGIAGRLVLVSYDPGGLLRWVVPTALDGFDASVTIGTDGSVLVAGGAGTNVGVDDVTVSNGGGVDAVVISLSAADGRLRWARAWGGADRDVAAQAAGEEGALYVAGSFRDAVRFDEVRTADANDGFLLLTD